MKQKLNFWWNAECKTFNVICGSEGDCFTNGEVIMANAAFAVFMFVALGMGTLLS